MSNPVSDQHTVVAIDGPSGSGKSSVSRGVAEVFSFRYLDTGAMYRAATWQVLHAGIDPADAVAVAHEVSQLTISSGTDPREPTIEVNGTDVAAAIRGDEVTNAVSLVSAVADVRSTLVTLQRSEVANSLAAGQGIVVEGRDIGTVVLPDATVKIFLTADAAVRARRRSQQDAESQHGSRGDAATEESLLRRDQIDSQRKASPLRPAEDAVEVDATDLDLAQTIDAVVRLVEGGTA